MTDHCLTSTKADPACPTTTPFSESHFKTLRYSPDFLEHFTGIEHARTFADAFLGYYNHQHHHSGLALMTPADVHHGNVEPITSARQQVLDNFHRQHPERFHTPPRAPQVPDAVWINKPQEMTPSI